MNFVVHENSMNQRADEIEVLEKRVKELEEIADRYGAVMDEINCDFEDMFPEWGEDGLG